MPKLVFHKKAAKYLKRMDARISAQLLTKIQALALNPDEAANVKAMEGDFEGCHRLRHGDMRVIFLWDKEQDTIVITAIGPRGDIYK
jgi:mRNA interferase RelE/StbE